MGSRFVLLVDDEVEAIETLAAVLTSRGHQVALARDGRQALGILEGPRVPDVVLLDLFMPDIDGYELLQRIQRNPRLSGMAVVISTSSPAAAPAGQRVLAKPLDLHEVLRAIENAAPAAD